MADAARTDYLIDIARRAAEARKGEKAGIYALACQHLGCSHATLHRWLNEVSLRPKRKTRSDAGRSALTYEQASLLAGYLQEHIRRQGKRIKTVEQAVMELRANGLDVGTQMDVGTGEILGTLSVSAILRALRSYGLHPGQLAARDPSVSLKSPHPNWCWQIDASLCVIFKLPAGGHRVEEIKAADLYKNKLDHLVKIQHLLVQRYLLTDHASGAIVAHFGLGGESADGLVSALITAFLGQPGQPMRGVPKYLMLDQASANRSAMVRNLCRSLQVELLYTQPGNPRSKGQVECAHNLFEKGFESGLRLAGDITDVEQLAELARPWLSWFNGSRPHSRHGLSRWEAWQLITGEQLRLVDTDAKTLRLLARTDPKPCKVDDFLRVSFKGQEYDVSAVPGVIVGQKLDLCRSGFEVQGAVVVMDAVDGHESLIPVPRVEREGPFQWPAGAATIGQDFKRHADTRVQTAKKRIERSVMGADTDEAAAAARKAGVVPFGGAIDPYLPAKQYQPPTWLPKRGVEVPLPRPEVHLPPATVAGAAKRLMAALGADWRPAFYAALNARYPDGVPEADMPALAEEFRATAQGERPARGAPSLRVVGE